MDPAGCGWMCIPRPSVRVHLGLVFVYTSAQYPCTPRSLGTMCVQWLNKAASTSRSKGSGTSRPKGPGTSQPKGPGTSRPKGLGT